MWVQGPSLSLAVQRKLHPYSNLFTFTKTIQDVISHFSVQKVLLDQLHVTLDMDLLLSTDYDLKKTEPAQFVNLVHSDLILRKLIACRAFQDTFAPKVLPICPTIFVLKAMNVHLVVYQHSLRPLKTSVPKMLMASRAVPITIPKKYVLIETGRFHVFQELFHMGLETINVFNVPLELITMM